MPYARRLNDVSDHSSKATRLREKLTAIARPGSRRELHRATSKNGFSVTASGATRPFARRADFSQVRHSIIRKTTELSLLHLQAATPRGGAISAKRTLPFGPQRPLSLGA
jgi:hypothetical protein